MKRQTKPAGPFPAGFPGRKFSVLLAAVFWALLPAGCGGKPSPPKGPPPRDASKPPPAKEAKARSRWFSQVRFDAGRVDEGTLVQHSFPFRNPDPGPRKILAVQKDCACAEVKILFGGKTYPGINPMTPPLTIPPGGKGEVRIALDTTAVDGPKSAGVSVQVDEPGNPWIHLSLEALSRIYFWPDPRSVALGEMEGTETRSFTFDVYSKRAKRWRITRVDAPGEYKVRLRKFQFDGRDAWKGEVTLGPGLPPGNHSATLVLYTDYENRKVSLPVKVFVRPPWETEPARALNFGPLQKGRSKTLVLTVRNLTGKRRLQVKGLRILDCNRPLGMFRLDPRVVEPGWRVDVRFTALGTLPPGPFKGILLVKTDSPVLAAKRIPFHGFVKK